MTSPTKGPSEQPSQTMPHPETRAEAVTLSPSPSSRCGEYYIRFTTRDETTGPLTELAVRNMIQERRLGITDMVREAGDSTWIVISESNAFRSLVLTTTSGSQLQDVICPYCQGHMVARPKRSTSPTVPIWVGIVTTIALIGLSLWVVTPTTIALIGLPLIAIGLIWRARWSTTSYRCPRCTYSIHKDLGWNVLAVPEAQSRPSVVRFAPQSQSVVPPESAARARRRAG
jgi:hypothetical protein